MNRISEKKKTAVSLRELLTGLIDYAGLFPPASLDMRTAVWNYSRYRAGEHAWMLGRFIVPVSRLAEFEHAAADAVSEAPWRLSALVADAAREIPVIVEFNARWARRFNIDAVELKTASAEDVVRAREAIPSTITPYFEIDPAKASTLLPAIVNGGARAKIRTGGIKAEMFPSAETIAGFIFDCLEENVAFKATAGLHHPVRCVRTLTYEADAPKAMMHGYLNVFAAVILAKGGAERDRVAEVIGCEDADEFHFSDNGLSWRGLRASAAQIKDVRERFAISFGSCSFEEPISDLQQLNLL